MTYRGLPGYALHTASWAEGTLRTSYDTTYESTGVYLKHRQATGDSAAYVTLYKIPFLVGDWWRTGAEGVCFTLPDSTGQVDTIRIWADTSRVVAQETVTTLYGMVPDCYRIRTFSRWFIATSLQGIPIRDSQTVVNVQWYKDSLWLVKDSTWSTGKFYAFIFVWLPAGVNFIMVNRELVSLGDVGIKDVPLGHESAASGWRVSPNPFRSSCGVTVPGSVRGKRNQDSRCCRQGGLLRPTARLGVPDSFRPATGVYRVISPGVPGAATIVHTD